MSSTQHWAVAVAAALALAAPLSAQHTAPGDADHALLTSSLFATTLGSLRSAHDSAEAAFVAPVVRGARARESENVAMMIVGGAALVVGSVVDGDAGTLIMVGGGVVGLIGLYRYLR
jgi:hypothetical protein